MTVAVVAGSVNFYVMRGDGERFIATFAGAGVSIGLPVGLTLPAPSAFSADVDKKILTRQSSPRAVDFCGTGIVVDASIAAGAGPTIQFLLFNVPWIGVFSIHTLVPLIGSLIRGLPHQSAFGVAPVFGGWRGTRGFTAGASLLNGYWHIQTG